MKPAQQHETPNTSISKVQTTSPAIGPSTPSAAPHTASRLPPFSLACLMPLIPQPNAANPMGIPKTAHPNWGKTMLVRAAPAPRRKAAFASPLSDVRGSSGRFVLSPDSVRRRRTVSCLWAEGGVTKARGRRGHRLSPVRKKRTRPVLPGGHLGQRDDAPAQPLPDMPAGDSTISRSAWFHQFQEGDWAYKRGDWAFPPGGRLGRAGPSP